MVRLIVHIGGAKCGSSALQRYLANNAAALRKNGVLIPGSKLDMDSEIDGHQLWFYEQMRPFGPDQHKAFFNRLGRLRVLADKEGLNTVIISGENLINPHGFHNLFTGIEKLFEPEVILYARRQDDYIISAWQQWYLKRGVPLATYLEQNVGKTADWSDQLLPWEEVIGQKRIRVRRYGKQYLLKGDIVEDFMTTMRVPAEGCAPLNILINRSFSEVVGRMASRVPDVFTNIHDNRFYGAMTYAIGEPAFKKDKGSSLFTLEERLRIFESYANSNKMLKAKYFPGLKPDEALFAPPDAKDVNPLTEEQKRVEEHDMLIRAVYRLAEKVKVLEQKK